MLLEKASADFDWSEISPTIFGAVFESTLNPETRRSGGMHYTSIENIHKVIDPLFLDDLKNELKEIQQITVQRTKDKKLRDFQTKLSNLRWLDPASGSGNFLTETYISIRRLENEVIKELQRGQITFGFDEASPIHVSIDQFYGIEINDFAVTVAKTALWIAESQMMKETEDIVHMNLDFLPLTTNAFIVEGNALELDWESVVSSMPEDLCYLSGKYLEDYLHDVEICQAFARRSREKMAEIILERTGMAGREAFHTIHNYIDTDEMILRKGAIAAHSGEKVLIPINMRDGSVLAVGKGNPEWNYSAPHGAGRLMSRTKAKANLSMDEYRETMKGIYTTSINENTLDEAPMAYKSLEDIIDVIRESVDVIDVMKPIYNFKASD